MNTTVLRCGIVLASVGLLAGCGASNASQPVTSTSQVSAAVIKTTTSTASAPAASANAEADIAAIERSVNTADSVATELEADANSG